MKFSLSIVTYTAVFRRSKFDTMGKWAEGVSELDDTESIKAKDWRDNARNGGDCIVSSMLKYNQTLHIKGSEMCSTNAEKTSAYRISGNLKKKKPPVKT